MRGLENRRDKNNRPVGGPARSNEQQILADYTSMQTKIPAELWTELKFEKLTEENAPTPA